MPPVKVQILNIIKNFEQKKVLDNITLDVYEGESLVILGGSGAGKTVLIKILASLLKPTSGSIKINSNFNSPKISFLFQLNALFDAYPIWKNICLANIENEDMKTEDAINLAKQMLKKVDLTEETAFLFPSDISGGMQKRVALARCLTSNPEIIFFDEPTSGLDPLTSAIISKLIREIGTKEKITKISIMHDVKCAKIVADRILFLLNGKIEWLGTVEEMENSTNQNLNLFIGKEK